MKIYNCIVVFHKSKEKALFCKRIKPPYQGLYNFAGGKVEEGEAGPDAAYRELQEETGISRDDIQLVHLMDFVYYAEDYKLEIYAGQLHHEIRLREEVNPLEWLSVEEDFSDQKRFAGEQNIAHIMNMAKKYPMDKMSVYCLDKTGKCIGVDGCKDRCKNSHKNVWIAAVISDGRLQIQRYDSVAELVRAHPVFDGFLIDMVIGLPGSKAHIRPDKEVRKMLGKRHSTVFPVPCRQAVYAESKEKQDEENQKALGKKLSAQSKGIIPKMRELDEFLNYNPQYRNVIKESHPEACFARLNGAVLMSDKKQDNGLEERAEILRKYLPEVDIGFVMDAAKKWKCGPDDIADAICLAVTAKLYSQGYGETIPEKPMRDDAGLLMQMVIPKIEGAI